MAVQRDEKGRVQPGSASLNPGGRPAAARRFSSFIGEQTKDGEELAGLWLSIIRNTKATRAEKIEASKLLAAYWIGKPPRPLTGEGGEGPVEIEGLRELLLKQPEALLERLEADLKKQGAGGTGEQP